MLGIDVDEPAQAEWALLIVFPAEKDEKLCF